MGRTIPNSRCRISENGQALVEFAVVLPILVLVVLASLELARIVVVKQHLISAARLGARTGTIRNSAIADVDNALSTYLSSTEVGTSYTRTISGVSAEADFNSQVTVTVNHNLTLFSNFRLPGVSGVTVPLSATVTMRHQ